MDMPFIHFQIKKIFLCDFLGDSKGLELYEKKANSLFLRALSLNFDF